MFIEPPGFLAPSQGHSVYIEEWGSRAGLPLLHFHGGPGGGVEQSFYACADPDRFRVFQFDQRGCGQSRPPGELSFNATQLLLQDAERLRAAKGVDRWIVSGGSWGATLALLYAQRFPQRVAGIVLRGVFLGEASELSWIGGALRCLRPAAFARLQADLGLGETSDPYAAFVELCLGSDQALAANAAMAFERYETACAQANPDLDQIEAGLNAEASLQAGRINAHYIANRFFLEPGQVMAAMPLLAHIPGEIINGAFDLVTPPLSAWRLAAAWPAAHLTLVPLAGHMSSDPAIGAALRAALGRLADRIA
jgi:proline iminopeptidase